MATPGYVSPDEIFSEVTMMIGDEPAKELSRGFHMGSMQKALSELAFDTYFDVRTWSAPLTDLTLALPEGVWNIEHVLLFNGTDCEAGPVRNVYFKEGFTRYAKAAMMEQRGEMDGDPFMESTITQAGGICYYNTLDNYLMLSDACGGWANVYVKYRGMGCAIGSAPIIPAQLRQAVTDYCTWRALKALKARGNPISASLLQDIKRDLFGGNGPLEVGSWKQAQRRVQDVDIKAHNDYAKYLSNLSLKII
jgi:hypothetical protein